MMPSPIDNIADYDEIFSDDYISTPLAEILLGMQVSYDTVL